MKPQAVVQELWLRTLGGCFTGDAGQPGMSCAEWNAAILWYWILSVLALLHADTVASAQLI